MVTDHALRRTVVDLEALGDSDQAAILEMLEPSQRTRVEALLRDYAGLPANHFDMPEAPIDVSDLSAWLADRLLAEGQMTAKARIALRECAASSSIGGDRHDVQDRPSLLGRLWSARPGAGRA